MSPQAEIWTSDQPSSWPNAPAYMTVTTLSEIESCPRRWGLAKAHYPQVWSGQGYPPTVHLTAISGTVVHSALEMITKALVVAGCSSLRDQTTIQVMKDLGGYSKIVNDCIDQVLERLENNPRADRVLEFIGRSIHAKLPEFRTRTQTMLCSVRLPQLQAVRFESEKPQRRGSLPLGVFPEIEVRAEQIGWKGKLDLLVLSSDRCEITDFKTGMQNDKHKLQIQTYALLWYRDSGLNPTHREANRLMLCYPDGNIEINTPTKSELDELEQNLINRASDAYDAISRVPPEAKPNPQNCPFCDVRHLCNEYWTDKTQRLLSQNYSDHRVADAEIKITGRHGPSSWDALVQTCAMAQPGQTFLLRSDNRSLPLHSGQVVRLLSVHISDSKEQCPDEPIIGTMGALSEVFLAS